MEISILVNVTNSAILAASAADMAGNTDWHRVELPEQTARMLLTGDIFDDHGAALYKWTGSEVVVRSEEERRQEWPEPETPTATIDERMTTAEGEIKDLGTALDIILEGRMPE